MLDLHFGLWHSYWFIFMISPSRKTNSTNNHKDKNLRQRNTNWFHHHKVSIRLDWDYSYQLNTQQETVLIVAQKIRH